MARTIGLGPCRVYSWELAASEVHHKSRTENLVSVLMRISSFHAVAPVLVTGPEDMNVTSFEEIRLSCEGNGFLIPDITWYHNGTALDADMDENTTITTTPTSSTQTVMSELVISMAMVNDSGDYHCVLSSSVGDFEEVMSEMALVLIQSKLIMGGRVLLNSYHCPQIVPSNHKIWKL